MPANETSPGRRGALAGAVGKERSSAVRMIQIVDRPQAAPLAGRQEFRTFTWRGLFFRVSHHGYKDSLIKVDSAAAA